MVSSLTTFIIQFSFKYNFSKRAQVLKLDLNLFSPRSVGLKGE